MKKIYAIILTVLALSFSLKAQDARQRTVETIVGDVLNEMPAQNTEAQAAAMLDIAKTAPKSIEMLAGKLQSADKGVNNKIEYALNGITNFAVTPGNEAYRDAILQGLTSASAATADKYNKQFIESQIRLLGKAENPAIQTFDPDLDEGRMIKAIKGSDRKLRGNILRHFAPTTDEFASKLAKKYKSMGNDAKQDVLYWIGDNKIVSQTPLVLSAFKDPCPEVAVEAIKAAGKLGGIPVSQALIGELGGDNGETALSALRYFPDNLQEIIPGAIAAADGQALDKLLIFAWAKNMKSCFTIIYDLARKSNERALDALQGVVSPEHTECIAKALDEADEKDVKGYSAAFAACIKHLSGDEQYDIVKKMINGATNKERFYPALALSGTNDAVDDLTAAFKGGSKKALKALVLTRNYRALPTLFKPARKGDQAALDRYVKFAEKYQPRLDDRCDAFCQALPLAEGNDRIGNIIRCLASTPTPKAFEVVKPFLDNKDLALVASRSIKDIVLNCTEDLDAASVAESLEKAMTILKTLGSPDDGYAVDEIKKFLSEKKEISPIFTLSEEEKAQGFVVLFDGTSLENFEGNKDGYKIVNNVIQVSAGFGSGNLYTRKQYSNFVYRFEFCFTRDGANNGVGVRTPRDVNAAYEGMCEVQILDHDSHIYDGWLAPYQVHGSVYGVIPAKRIVHKPMGEWGEEEIRVEGTHIKVTVNGEVIVDGDIREACQGHGVAPDGGNDNPYTMDHRNHPGIFNETGYIGFLGHGPGVKFRNIRILELK